MTLLGRWLYTKALLKHPYMVSGQIPYEKVSAFYLWKLQKQMYYKDYTVGLVLRHFGHSIRSSYKGWIFRRGYYEKDGKVYNKYTDSPYYIHDQKGMYKVQGKPCNPDCKYCKQTVVTYPERGV
jgi:hypothetical protein